MNDLDFIFYITKPPKKGGEDRCLITQNMQIPEPDNRILEFCKKRDEFNVIKPIVNANINELLTNFITQRNNILKQQQLKEIN